MAYPLKGLSPIHPDGIIEPKKINAQPITETAKSVEYRMNQAVNPALAPPPVDPAAQYDQAFQDSLAQARSAVDAQIRNALGEISRAEGSQQQAIGTLPGQYDTLYNLAYGQMGQLGTDAEKAQANLGIKVGTPSGTMMAPLQGAMGMARATQQGGVPLLKLAATEQAAQNRGLLAQIQAQMLADLMGEERSYTRDRARTTQDRSFELEDRAYNEKRDEAMRREQMAREDFQRQQDMAHDLKLRQMDAQRSSKSKSRPFGAMEVSAERGSALKRGPQLRQDSAYTKFIRDLQENPPVDDVELYERVTEFRKKNKKANTQAMSMALFDLYGLDG